MGKKLLVSGGSLIRKTPDPQIKSGYGALYNWFAVEESANQGGFVTGFHVPSDAEWTVLTDYIQAEITADRLPDVGIGNILKSCRQVNSPLDGDCDTEVHPRWNEDADYGNYGRNSVKLSVLPGGYRFNTFEDIGLYGEWWGSERDTTFSWSRWIYFNYFKFDRGYNDKVMGLSARCLRTTALTSEESALADGTIINTVQDFNGNYYEVVKIGTQAWLAQNIRCTNYANGEPIPNVTDDTKWSELTTHAYCWYNNDINTAGIVYTDEQIPSGPKKLTSS